MNLQVPSPGSPQGSLGSSTEPSLGHPRGSGTIAGVQPEKGSESLKAEDCWNSLQRPRPAGGLPFTQGLWPQAPYRRSNAGAEACTQPCFLRLSGRLNNSWPSLPWKLQPWCAPKGRESVCLLTSCLLCRELQDEEKLVLQEGTLAKTEGRQGRDEVR